MKSASTAALAALLLFSSAAQASIGDRLPEFKSCISTCKSTNCGPDGPSIPIHRHLLLWTCPSECDYTCQHIITSERLARDPPYRVPVQQFHGKWPFHRFLGMQEPFSVLFSALNLLAHEWGIAQLRTYVPESYRLRKWYLGFGYMGVVSWVASCVFHTRDFSLTEKVDYFAAGGSVMYGLYLAPVRIWRLDEDVPLKGSLLRLWTVLCAGLYAAHVAYLGLWRFDYTYNMAANVAVGILQNGLWTWFSVSRYNRVKRAWTIWPGLIVAWIILAMSLELFDFPPWGGMVDAHSLWHLGTVGPTIWWYNFLVKDAQEDIQSMRLKA
ncbi:Per1-like protein [Myriangium duriaei CBS 260.36]|uniref:Post-GPI attachment to proteins factor 3 n=1 Tax=Myriangium duriaei CBS 260.36 TaxID=1168546 RepID=A0A9P4MGL9_9PEZI|nr:Per1-like protein [Myriangium duriaei CBS 260.36]